MYEEDKKTDRGQDSEEQTSDVSSEGTGDGPPRIRNLRIETRTVSAEYEKLEASEYEKLEASAPPPRRPRRSRKKED